jgi:hypothetical protein
MKTLNKEELKAVAADIFGRYTKAEKVAVTSDGMSFITDEGDNAVLNHSKRNVSGKELAISRFTRDEVEGKTEKAKGKSEKPNAGEGKPETGKGKTEPKTDK